MADVLLHGEVLTNQQVNPPTQDTKQKPPLIIDGETSKPIGANNAFQPQKFAEAVVNTAEATGTQIPVVNAIGDVLREERQRDAVAAGKLDQASTTVAVLRDETAVVRKSLLQRIKDWVN